MNIPVPKTTPNGIEGHIIHIDRYGNIITNIAYEDIKAYIPEGVDLGSVSVGFSGKEIKGLKKYYAETAPGALGAIINSSGVLEIFMFKQNAKTALSLKRGEAVRFWVSP